MVTRLNVVKQSISKCIVDTKRNEILIEKKSRIHDDKIDTRVFGQGGHHITKREVPFPYA